MILKKISLENIRSYESQEISFPKGSTLLSGDVGSGKTTVLLAIEFALFGLQPSQKGASLLRNSEEQGKVTLDFEIDGKEVTIERSLKRSSKSVSQTGAEIIIDNEKIQGSVTEIKNKVLELLNYPSEFSKKTNLLYKFTVYTPQEEMKQIILESRDVRLNTLRHVFGIDKYKKIQENTSILTSKLREKIRQNEGVLQDLEELKKSLEDEKGKLESLKQKQKEIEKEYNLAVDFKNQKQKALDEIQKKIDEKKSLENEKSKSDVLISEKDQQIHSLNKNINDLKDQIQEAKKLSFNKEEYEGIEQRIKYQQEKEESLQKEYMEIIGKINSNESKKQETQSLKNKISGLDKCPTCLQKVSEEYKNNILSTSNKELEAIENKLKSLQKQKQEITEKINETKSNKEQFQKRKSELEILKVKLDSLNEKQESIKNTENQILKIKKDKEMLVKHTQSINQSIKEYQKYDKIHEARKKELESAEKAENNKAIKKAENNKEIQFSEQQIKKFESKIQKKEEIKKENDKIRELESWLSSDFLNLILNTEKQVMLTLKQKFSELFSKWFSTLVSDSLSAKLNDDFSPIIEEQDYELDYSYLSGGERTAIALAYRLALNQVINSLMSSIKTNDLVILDEPTDGFSEQQLDKMRDVLQQLNTEQLILVSHEQKIEGFVDNIIRFTKDRTTEVN